MKGEPSRTSISVVFSRFPSPSRYPPRYHRASEFLVSSSSRPKGHSLPLRGRSGQPARRGGSRRESTSGHRHERVSSPVSLRRLNSAPLRFTATPARHAATRQSAPAAPASLHTLSRCIRRTRFARIPRLSCHGTSAFRGISCSQSRTFFSVSRKGKARNAARLRMREIVHLQAGQCGNQIGAKVGRAVRIGGRDLRDILFCSVSVACSFPRENSFTRLRFFFDSERDPRVALRRRSFSI